MSDLIRKNEYFAKSSSLLSVVLSKQCSFFKPCLFDSWLSDLRLQVNGSFVSLDVFVSVGDLITLLTPKSLEPFVDDSYELLFEDDYFFVVNKPANLPIHPAGKYYFNTLTYILTRDGFDSDGKLFPVNRLDRETSGLVLFAKSSVFAAKLQKMFFSNSVDKVYEAIVFGKILGDSVIDSPLLKSVFGEIRDHMTVSKEGLPSKTIIHLISSSKYYSYIQATLHSGRRHQIRAHLAHIGHPIVGDKQYGLHPDIFVRFVKDYSSVSKSELLSKLNASRQLLHCKKLRFKHPVTAQIMCFEAKLPSDFADFIDNKLN